MPVVLIPGMNCSSRLWQRCAIPFDVSTVIPSKATIDAAVHELLRQLPPRFILGGLSLGGIVTMALLRVAPHRVAGVLLMATNARGPTDDQLMSWAVGVRRLETGLSPIEFQREIIDLLLSPAAARRPGCVNAALDVARDIRPATLIDQLRMQMTRIDERPALTRVAAPVEVLAGSADRLCPVTNHVEIAELVPDARLTIAEGAGHLIPLEQPDEVVAAIARLRDRVDHLPSH